MADDAHRKGKWPLQASVAVLWPAASTGGRFFRAGHWIFVSRSVQPELGNVAWVLFEYAALDLFDDVDEPLIGARLNP